jgi:hypothetical protein
MFSIIFLTNEISIRERVPLPKFDWEYRNQTDKNLSIYLYYKEQKFLKTSFIWIGSIVRLMLDQPIRVEGGRRRSESIEIASWEIFPLKIDNKNR